MGVQFAIARAVSALSTWGLKSVFHRPAANFPGKVALYVDSSLIADLAPRLRKGSIVVVGTNGKTTTTNLLADALEADGASVVCNRTGANLDSGVATSLLQSKGADWGLFECDELWLAKVLPQLQATYVLLLNLFRDQLDRCGEIDRIQNSIVAALETSPNTVLIYNADDPLCAYIADCASNATIAFGVAEDMGLSQNTVADAQMCQRCSSMFEYTFRQYGQLGDYYCPQCGFARPSLDFAASNTQVAADGVSFTLAGAFRSNKSSATAEEPGKKSDNRREIPSADDVVTRECLTEKSDTPATFSSEVHRSDSRVISSSLCGAYMVYNLAAVAVAADQLGCSEVAFQRALAAFDPQNGRLQHYKIAGRQALLNLAKNPTGFNQNLRIVEEDTRPKAVAFFVNDKEADGHDISWLWDVDFEELASQRCSVFAGGLRKNDVQVRLKYAGIKAQLVDGAQDVFTRLPDALLPDGSLLPSDANVYLIANYTALPSLQDDMKRMALEQQAEVSSAATEASASDSSSGATVESAPVPAVASISENIANTSPLVIVHLFPDLLNLYGDGGNVRILSQRCSWRSLPVEIIRVHYGETIDLSQADVVFLGGGPDREQRLASEELMRMKDDLRAFVEDGGTLLAICGGFQILGNTWLLGDDVVEGLGIVDIATRRPGTSGDRLIDNIVLRSPLAARPVVGYENHAGRTYLGSGVQPLGNVMSSMGHGNNEVDRSDGVYYRNVVGTYLHGPFLSKNPEVADKLLNSAFDRWAKRHGGASISLAPLDDAEEVAANDYMCNILGVK